MNKDIVKFSNSKIKKEIKKKLLVVVTNLKIQDPFNDQQHEKAV